MAVRNITAVEHRDFLGLVDEALRPPGSTTRASDDFPVVLSLRNREGLFAIEQAGRIVSVLACLVRRFRTSLGEIPVAGIGSVVTRPDCRGQGHSSRLQGRVLDHLKSREVPLAVLWTDHPQWYAGRGFTPSGVEYHVDLQHWSADKGNAPGLFIRPYQAEDAPWVARLYRAHPFCTLRRADEDASLYGMPGTRGLVATDTADRPSAYLFCGKGADFPGYVLEWGGPLPQVAELLIRVRAARWASSLLVPQGGEALLRKLAREGARWTARSSGLWAVLAAGKLERLLEVSGVNKLNSGRLTGVSPQEASTWLGSVEPDGSCRDGLMQLAVWGFDSV